MPRRSHSALLPRAPPARSDAETVAWILIIPCGVLLIAAIALLGPILGDVLFRPLDPSRIWAWKRGGVGVAPEPREQMGYLLLVIAAAGLAVAIPVLTRSAPRLASRLRLAPSLARLALLALIVGCVVVQYRLRYGSGDESSRAWYFIPRTWIVAAVIATGLVLAIRSSAVRRRVLVALRERPGAHALAVAFAFAVTSAVMLVVVDTDATLVTHGGVNSITPYVLDEAFAVVNGLTPFVSFQPLYASLWPMVTALPMTIVAPTLLVFTLTMYMLSVLSLVAVFGVLCRVTRNSAAATLLYLPFLATSLFLIGGTVAQAYSAGNYYPAFPLRYAGPYMLAWLTARELESQRRSHWMLFSVAGLVVLNNANFGAPALAGTIAAILCTSGQLRRTTLLGLARDVAAGLVTAIVALSALTLVRTGALPDLRQLFGYASYFLGGFSATPIPALLGVHVLFYLTFAAALATAAVRACGHAANRALTGMLAWSGMFGLGAGSYFIAESGTIQLKVIFSAWALALALLVVVVVQRLIAQPRRRPNLAEVAVLLGIGVMTCSIAQLPRPWTQLDRLTSANPEPAGFPRYAPHGDQRTFAASIAYGPHDFYVKPGAPVVLLVDDGHGIAETFGVLDVNRYTNVYTMLGPAFLRQVVADLRHAGGNTIVVPLQSLASGDFNGALARWGFGVLTATGVQPVEPKVRPVAAVVGYEAVVKWVDLHNLRPDALRGGRGQLVASYPKPR